MGEYTTASAYNAQLLGTTATNFNRLIWKAWAPHKCKTFAWLIIQNRVWTSDKLATRGWPNGSICPLCRRTQETALHLLAACRYTRRVWAALAEWVTCEQLNPSQWRQTSTVLDWWEATANIQETPKKTLRTLMLLVAWKIWNERNRRTFQQKELSATSLLAKIKEEAKTWVLAGAISLNSWLSFS
uniref:Cyst nematode resistance protein-like n=1 Tax=Oryza sativa subsp. japonica TaxID=39947 RepID=Q5SMW3_ORYSJ|nr:cyst nematode resistance protein-like [Oryza sativa Japonica Group]